jgi:hypothetical protein
LAQVALPTNASAAISELTAWAARRYLVEEEAGFAYLHALTASASLRTLLPILDSGAQQAALEALVQALVAMELTHRSSLATADPGTPSAEGLVDKAVDIANDHGIKYVEAVLAEDRVDPRPERVAAAWKTLGRLAG